MKSFLGNIIFILWSALCVGSWLFVDEKASFLIGEFLFNSLVVGTIILSAFFIGSYIISLLRIQLSSVETLLTALSLGVGVDILILIGVGFGKLLYQQVIILMIGLPLVLSASRIKNFFANKRWHLGLRDFNPAEISIIFCLVIVSGVVLVAVLVPENFYDALYYHDAFAMLFLLNHKVEIYPYAVHSAMPLNIDLLYVMPLAFASSGSARLLHFFFYLGTAGWVYSTAKNHFGNDSALFAIAIWMTIPGVCWMAGLGAVDMGVTFFEMGAMSLLLRWAFIDKGLKILLVSAVLLGLAVGAKYTALMVGVICAIWLLGSIWTNKSELGLKKSLLSLVLFGALSLAIASPWYIRNLLQNGTPIYPALSKIGTLGDHARQNLRKDSVGLYPPSATFTKLPRDMWLKSEKFGAGSLLGLGMIIIVPALLYCFTKRGISLYLSTGILLLYLMWSRSILIVRYLYPALALGAVAGGVLFTNWQANRFKKITVIFLVILFTLYNLRATAIFYEMPAGQGDVIGYIGSTMTPDQYLAKYCTHYKGAKFVNENLPSSAKLLFIGETMGYYFQRQYLPVSAYDRHPLEEWIIVSGDSSSLTSLLKKEGFSHIILNRREWERLRKGYGYLNLDKRGSAILNDMLASLPKIYDDRKIEIYELRK